MAREDKGDKLVIDGPYQSPPYVPPIYGTPPQAYDPTELGPPQPGYDPYAPTDILPPVKGDPYVGPFEPAPCPAGMARNIYTGECIPFYEETPIKDAPPVYYPGELGPPQEYIPTDDPPVYYWSPPSGVDQPIEYYGPPVKMPVVYGTREPDDPPTQYVNPCPQGYHQNNIGVCVMDAPGHIIYDEYGNPVGTTNNVDGGGGTRDPADLYIGPAIEPKPCRDGYARNVNTGECISVYVDPPQSAVCPAGQAWSDVFQSCVAVYTDPGGVVEDPPYPIDYPTNIVCGEAYEIAIRADGTQFCQLKWVPPPGGGDPIDIITPVITPGDTTNPLDGIVDENGLLFGFEPIYVIGAAAVIGFFFIAK